MKKIKIIILIFLLIIPWIVLAKKWYKAIDQKTPKGFSVNSWVTYCPNWYVLPYDQQYVWQWRNWTLECYPLDSTPPIISANWYSENTWVNWNVKINVSISDNVWVWEVYASWVNTNNLFYVVNWEIFYKTTTNFSIDLTEEWYYLIQIYAYDKAGFSLSSKVSGLWNFSSKQIKVKIDKSEPVFESWTNSALNWINNKPTVKYKISDLYKWENIKIKDFTCPVLTSNATYKYPVVNNVITGICNPNISWNCSIDSNYTPNLSNCIWECNDWYIKVWSSCVLKTIIQTCNNSTVKLPQFLYNYDKTNTLVTEWTSSWKIYWTSPTWVSVDWFYTSNYNISTNQYDPSLNTCNYSCSDWYHKENSKCVNDTSVTCCSKPPLWYLADTWAQVDCTNTANQWTPQCQYNTLCWWYLKDVLWEWNYGVSKWTYTDSTLNTYSNLSNACWYTNIPNSDWYTCNPKYYLIWSEATSTLKCENVPIWEWSWQENWKHACTNAPANWYYTSNWDNKNCLWDCNKWFEKNWSSCKSYDWYTSARWSCSASCWWWTKSRSVYCVNSKWQQVNDSLCIGTKPETITSCNTQACPTCTDWIQNWTETWVDCWWNCEMCFSCTPIEITSYIKKSAPAWWSATYDSNNFNKIVNFKFRVWTDDLKYDIQCKDINWNVLTSFWPWPWKDENNNTNYFPKDQNNEANCISAWNEFINNSCYKTCSWNQLHLKVTEWWNLGSWNFWYQLYWTYICK